MNLRAMLNTVYYFLVERAIAEEGIESKAVQQFDKELASERRRSAPKSQGVDGLMAAFALAQRQGGR